MRCEMGRFSGWVAASGVFSESRIVRNRSFDGALDFLSCIESSRQLETEAASKPIANKTLLPSHHGPQFYLARMPLEP